MAHEFIIILNSFISHLYEVNTNNREGMAVPRLYYNRISQQSVSYWKMFMLCNKTLQLNH